MRNPKSPLFQRLKNNFLTGLIVVTPIGLTFYLTYAFFNFVDGTVLPWFPQEYNPEQLLPFSLPGLGVAVFVLFVTFVGGLAKNFLGREVLRVGEGWVDRMPVVRSLYNAIKQITETVFAQNGANFDRACLVEYPRRGAWSIAFIATETRGEVKDKASPGEEMMSIFLPTTPNPTSGFLLFVPERDVIVLDMSIEEAAKLIISAGLINPPGPHDAEGLTIDAVAEAPLEMKAAARRPLRAEGRAFSSRF